LEILGFDWYAALDFWKHTYHHRAEEKELRKEMNSHDEKRREEYAVVFAKRKAELKAAREREFARRWLLKWK
jgi:hypothetical protein